MKTYLNTIFTQDPGPHLDCVKEYLALNDDFKKDDDVISKLIKSARETCENYMHISIVKKIISYSVIFDSHDLRRMCGNWLNVTLPNPPIISINKIEILDILSGEIIELECDDYRLIENELYIDDMYNIFDISTKIQLKIEYNAGFEQNDIPQPILESINRLVQRAYVMKSNDITGLSEDVIERLDMFYRPRV